LIDTELAGRFSGKRVVVTGGLGFIGSSLAHELVAAGARVLLVDALIPEYGGNLQNIAGIVDRVEINLADLRDEHPLHFLLADADVLFNLAGQTSHLDSMSDPETDLDINCRVQLSVLEELRRSRLTPWTVFAGTRQVYGRPQFVPVDESHPTEPVDVNGIHKLAAEWYHLLYGRLYGIPVSVLRLTNTYGPRMRVRDARQTFLGVWFRNVLRGEEIVVYGDGSQRRDFTYVDDAVRAFLLAASEDAARGELFNLGGERSVSLLELAELLTTAHGGGSFRLVPFPDDRRAIDIGDYVADDRKIRDLLGWEPRVALEDGLARTLAYYREQGAAYWNDE
jgi:UDP-glucose 4-epimerase